MTDEVLNPPPAEKPILPEHDVLTISTSAPPTAFVGEAYSWGPTPAGGHPDAYKLSLVSGLPPEGMNFKDGVISGTCHEPGETPVTISVFDGVASVSHPYVITVTERPKLSLRETLCTDDVIYHDLLKAYTDAATAKADPVKTCALFCKLIDWLVKHPSDYALDATLYLFAANQDTFMEERIALQGFGHRGFTWQDEERRARVVYAYFRALSLGQKPDSLFGKLLSVTQCPQMVNFFRKKVS